MAPSSAPRGILQGNNPGIDRGPTTRTLAVVATLAFLAACAGLENPGGEQPSGHDRTLVEMRAMVIGVDQERRLLALEGDDGARMVLPVAEAFRHFEHARVGDQVVVSHTKAIAWQVRPSDNGAPGMSTRETLRNPVSGEARGGAIERAVTVTATITSLDTVRGTVTVTGPQGKSQTFTAHKPSDLEKVRVGDLVDATYTEALAVGVRQEARK